MIGFIVIAVLKSLGLSDFQQFKNELLLHVLTGKFSVVHAEVQQVSRTFFWLGQLYYWLYHLSEVWFYWVQVSYF
jgi:hypothetical protein